MRPAQQRLEGGLPPALRVKDRLINQSEFVATVERVPQFSLQLQMLQEGTPASRT
jgi:hypothetical protein